MKFINALALFIIITITASSAAALDQCTLLGDHAVMFAQWKHAGQPLNKTMQYIDSNYSGSSMQNLYKSLAQDIYTQKQKLTPRAWRMIVETQCKEALGIR